MNMAYNLVPGLISLFCFAASVVPVDSGTPEMDVVAQGNSGKVDPHSYGNPEQVQIQQVELDLEVDFDERRLKGIVILDVQRRPGTPPNAPLVLDTDGLAIDHVGVRRLVAFNPQPFAPAPFQLGPADPILGSKLSIELAPTTMQVLIKYHTSPLAKALQWLEPSRTAGKKKPFLFTQSQAIHARSWIPLHDSPGARVSYTAAIHVPRGLTAVMAAECVSTRRKRRREHSGFARRSRYPPI